MTHRAPLRLARTLFDLARAILAVYGRKSVSQFAAAISYRALFSIVPLATFVAMIVGLFLAGNDARRQQLVDTITERLHLTETGASMLDDIIASVPSPWSLAGVVTLALALWGATGVMSSMRKALGVIFDDGLSLDFARGKLVDGLIVTGVVVLLLVAVALAAEQIAAEGSERIKTELEWQPYGIGLVFGVVIPLLLTGRRLPDPLPRAAAQQAAVALGGHRRIGRGPRLSGDPGRAELVPRRASGLRSRLWIRERRLCLPALGLPQRERVPGGRAPRLGARRAELDDAQPCRSARVVIPGARHRPVLKRSVGGGVKVARCSGSRCGSVACRWVCALSRRGPVAQAVIGCAQVRAAFDHFSRSATWRLGS